MSGKRRLWLNAAKVVRQSKGWKKGFGEVTITAIFPRNAFGSDVHDVLEEEGFIPFGWGRWWKPKDPAQLFGAGTAHIALHGYESEDGDMPNRVYTLPITEDPESLRQSYPDLWTLIDKPHRVRNAEAASYSEDPAVWQAATIMFRLIEEANGFLPETLGALVHPGLYGDRWFLSLRWETTDRVEFGEFIKFMGMLRRNYGAELRIYRKSPQPCWVKDEAEFVVQDYRRWLEGARGTARP